MDLDYISFKDVPNIRVYKNFYNQLADFKFDLIFIDGPLGGDL